MNKIPENVKKIISAFESAGFEACAVGGCVRDAVLGREPVDWDICTSAKPEEVKQVFKRTVDTGIKHGTVTVLFNGGAYEVTTYRVDGEYEDGRHPKSVAFTSSLEEDLARRDFTINAMAYSDKLGLVDLFGGEEDLKAGIIRCVGDAEKRLDEDALRILRAYRFSAQLGFSIDPATEKACVKLAGALNKISAERVREEMTKLLVSDNPGILRRMYKDGVTKIILPEFDEMMKTTQDSRFHAYDVGEHTVKVVENISCAPILRWSALLHDVAKPECKRIEEETGKIHFKGHAQAGADLVKIILRRLKFDNASIDTIAKLIRWHGLRFKRGEADVRRCLCDIGPELFPLLNELQRADTLGKRRESIEEGLKRCDGAMKMYHAIIKRGDCYRIKDLAVNGKDLMDAGVASGPEIGAILEKMLEAVIDEPALNDKSYLMKTFVSQIAHI